MTTNRNFRITNKTTGADFGVYEAPTAASALALMHSDAGYEGICLDETGEELVFANAEQERLCGSFDRWSVKELLSA